MKAMYVRTSVNDNDGTAQIHELEQWCKKEGWQNVKLYFDRGQSGKKDKRPAWDELRAAIAKGKVDELVCTELSRLGRSVVAVVLALDEMHNRGCRVILLRNGLDYATPVGRAVAAILAAIAQLEREQICTRIRAGITRARESGTRSGLAIGRPRKGIASIDIKEAIRGLEAGHTWRSVASACNVAESTLRRAIKAHQNPLSKPNDMAT